MESNPDSDSDEGKEFDDQKYVQYVSYRGYTIQIEYNSEGVFYGYQNFENNVLKRAIRFIGGGAMYIANPILAGTEMVAAVLSDVFVKEGYELANKIKTNQTKLYNIDNKLDATVLSRCAASIKYGINCLKEYQMTLNQSEFKAFYEKVYQSLEELASFLSEKTPLPSFMNAVSTLTKLVEEGCNSLGDDARLPKELRFKYHSILSQVDITKRSLAKQWVRCLKYYKSQIAYGRKKIKGFFNRRVEYYADDKMHGISFKIFYKPPLIFSPKEFPDEVLRKYIESVHTDDYIIKECSLTYEYAKEKVDQELYPQEKYLYFINRDETGLMKRLLTIGKLLEDAQRYDDLQKLIIESLEQQPKDVSWNVKDQLKKWFMKLITPLQESIESVEEEKQDKENAEFRDALEKYKAGLNIKLERKCDEILRIIFELLLPKAKLDDCKLFYYQIIIDFYSIVLKIESEERHDLNIADTEETFKQACQVATNVKRCHPYSLKLTLEYARFLDKIKDQRKKAYEIVHGALKTAEDDLDDLKPDQKKEAVGLIKDLHDMHKSVKNTSWIGLLK